SSQLAAASVVCHTAPLLSATISRVGVCGSMARSSAYTAGKPPLRGTQVVPPSVLPKTPQLVGTYNVDGAVGSIATRPPGWHVIRPVGVQLVAPSVVFQMPFGVDA